MTILRGRAAGCYAVDFRRRGELIFTIVTGGTTVKWPHFCDGAQLPRPRRPGGPTFSAAITMVRFYGGGAAVAEAVSTPAKFLKGSDNMSARKLGSSLLAATVVAWLVPHAAGQVANSMSRLQPLVNDTVAQLQVAYRHDPAEGQGRYARLAEGIEQWRNAPRNEANDRLLAEWLRAAMRTSMPGSQAAFPAAPRFTGGPEAKSTEDPFGDDPLQE